MFEYEYGCLEHLWRRKRTLAPSALPSKRRPLLSVSARFRLFWSDDISVYMDMGMAFLSMKHVLIWGMILDFLRNMKYDFWNILSWIWDIASRNMAYVFLFIRYVFDSMCL